MVSAMPPAGGGGSGRGTGLHRESVHHHQQQKGSSIGVSVPGVINSVTEASAAAAEALSDDLNKKIRKPYTITKSRESWTEQEHDKFFEALQLFDRDWKKIEAFVGSKTVIQIRSHAQKYFLKVQKSGTSEHVPPPRPKRKAAHPYPQKAPKNGNFVSPPTNLLLSSSANIEPGHVIRSETSSVHRNSTASGTVSSLAQVSEVQPIDASHTRTEGVGTTGAMLLNNSFGSNSIIENPSKMRQSCETADQVHHATSVRAMPDFAQVYSFIGSVFDPNTTGHLEKLKEMDPIDIETVLLLMRNISINLTKSDVEGKSHDPSRILEVNGALNIPFL
ncbi:hypothetical protein HPP92_025312 [Vanilla planifolia]|nr:hypothetical protein HPP92_025312 [Vanilla planifolia]